MDRFNTDKVIKILGLEIRAEQADGGNDFDVACRIALNKIYKAKHYEDLEEKGLLVELPCSVGDSVYFIKAYFSYCKEPIEEKVDRIIITKDLVTFKTENRTFCLNDIGTKVFLTKSEAEQTLAERQE